MMFRYYGRKKAVVKKYPKPYHHTIIEPFAGSAAYSMEYYWHDVTIVDCYDVIIGIWRYLQQASKKDILSLPDVEIGEDFRKKHHMLTQDEVHGAHNKALFEHWLQKHATLAANAARALQPIWSQPTSKVVQFADSFEAGKTRFNAIISEIDLPAPSEAGL